MIMRLSSLVLLLALPLAACASGGSAAPAAGETLSATEEPKPFDETRDAMADVDAALDAAKASGKNVLVILGGNWCHDSRGFAMRLADPSVAAAANGYEVVFVDVGHRDRNLDVPTRFAVTTLLGTPTILVLSADGKLLNRASMHDWRNAAERSAEELRAYLESFAGAGETP
jgi:thiol-disulfide isomerase/thioredoxin